jgi:hypothetical protein
MMIRMISEIKRTCIDTAMNSRRINKQLNEYKEDTNEYLHKIRKKMTGMKGGLNKDLET